MASQWPEISTARREKRKELTLHGSEISERIQSEGLPKDLFKLNLNYLVISKTCLVELPESISKITDLARLCLPNNKLKSLPSSIGLLSKLKLLDLSNNELESLPDELNNLSSLGTLNLSVNKLTKLPAIQGLTALTSFDVSYNQLEYLPDGMCDNHDYLTEIKASHNNLVELPDELNKLARLATIDVSDNKLKDVPLTLCECSKLKEFIGKANAITERRLSKMVEQGQMKGMMTYLSAELQKKRALESKGEKKPKPKKKKKAKVDDDDVEELTKDMINILRFPSTEENENGFTVSVQVPVITVRPYIVCCIVRKLNFKKSLAMFKHFITLQTKLHDTICEQRQVATIATHELKSIKGPLTYTAEFPDLLKITPLFKLKEVTAKKLVTNLFEDAEALRKEKKRSTISGIHKYLELLKDKVQYPCLKDAEDHVISFPPITNSDKTKICSETTDILIEVTSSTNLDSCKKVMDEMLREMLKMGVGCSEDEEPHSSKEETTEEDGAGDTPKIPKNHHLVVEQVKIVDHEGNLKVLYPSRTDLLNPQYKVIRNF